MTVPAEGPRRDRKREADRRSYRRRKARAAGKTPEPAVRPRSLDAATMCAAFQCTAAERSTQVALRTIGDGVSITFTEYAERVRRLAAGLHALGVRRGDPVGLLLTNCPEFHLVDTAALRCLCGSSFITRNSASLRLCVDPGNKKNSCCE